MDRYTRKEIVRDFAEVVNKHSLENLCNTPDFILGEYLFQCLMNYNDAVVSRNNWYAGSDGSVINPMEPKTRDY